VKTLIFQHIPKTAGSTLRTILGKEYHKIFLVDSYHPETSIAKFEQLDVKEQNSFELIQGHAALQVLKYIHQPILLTYLREPIDCFISQFYYIKRTPDHRSYKALEGVNHVQTRILSDSALDFFGALKMVDTNENRSEMLSQAKNKLQLFDYVFLTHQFDLSLLILQKDLQWKYPPYYLAMNKTKDRPIMKELGDNLLEKIREVVKYDIELYELAKQMNQKLLANYSLEEQLTQFRHNNQLMKPFLLMKQYVRWMGRRFK
jgi:hypothetical protein